MHHILSFHSCVREHLGASALCYCGEHGCAEICPGLCFNPSVCRPRRRIAGSNYNSVFNFLTTHHSVSHSSCTISLIDFLSFVIFSMFSQQPAWRASSLSWAWSLRRHTRCDWQPSTARVWARSAQLPSSRHSQSVSRASCPAFTPPSSSGALGDPELAPHCPDGSFCLSDASAGCGPTSQLSGPQWWLTLGPFILFLRVLVTLS